MTSRPSSDMLYPFSLQPVSKGYLIIFLLLNYYQIKDVIKSTFPEPFIPLKIQLVGNHIVHMKLSGKKVTGQGEKKDQV